MNQAADLRAMQLVIEVIDLTRTSCIGDAAVTT